MLMLVGSPLAYATTPSTSAAALPTQVPPTPIEDSQSPPLPPPTAMAPLNPDPLEGWNRGVFRFNMDFNSAVIKPITI